MNSFFDALFLTMAQRSRLLAVIALVLVAVIALQVQQPVFSGSMVEDISEDNLQLQADQLIAEARGNKETIFVVVEAGNATIDQAFADVESLGSALEEAGLNVGVRSVHQLRGQLFLLGLSKDDSFSELLAALRLDEANSPLVSNDGRLFGIVILVQAKDEVRALKVIREHAFGNSVLGIDVLAAAALEQDVASGLRQDLRLLIPSIVLVMLGILLLAFGHWRALVLPVFGSIASATVVFGALSITNVNINLVTLLALPIVLIVALANSCHFLAKSAKAHAKGVDRDTVVALTLRRVAVPYLISCLTTSVALASLAFNEIGPIRDLGLLSSASLLISFVLVLLFAPWALQWHLGVRGRSAQSSPRYRTSSGRLLRGRRPIAALLVIGAVASLLTLPSVQVRSDARIFFPDNAPFTQAFRLFEERFYVFAPLRILLRETHTDAPTLQGLQLASRIRDSLLGSGGVLSTELVAADRGGGFLVTAYLANETVTAGLVSDLERIRAEHRGRYEITYSSGLLVYESIDQQAMASLFSSLLLTVFIIIGAIILLFRSPRALIAAAVANAIPLLMVFGVVFLVGDPLNLVTAFVFLVALGVIVDDTVHILYCYKSGGTLAGSSIEFSVVLSTTMLCAGLLLCQLSDFPTTRQFAMYFALALAAAVASDLTILPELLARGKNRRDLDRGA